MAIHIYYPLTNILPSYKYILLLSVVCCLSISHLHLAVCTGQAERAEGVWGPYNGAPMQVAN